MLQQQMQQEMKRKEEKGDVGVIVARFQVPWLHDVHKELIQHVLDEHEVVYVFLGLSQVRVTKNNPLDYEARRQMIMAEFPEDVHVGYVHDCKEDDVWSKSLDHQIGTFVGPSQTVTLYGGRDSFINHYKGKHPTKELVSDRFVSGTEIRKKISKKVKASPDFRAGVIHAAINQYPKVWATVDVAIVDELISKILLGKKPGENGYRFVGGFSDPTDDSFEDTAKREVQEETGLEVGKIEYLSSVRIDDWRYRSENDKIITNFYITPVIFGSASAGDDLSEVKWFDLNTFADNNGRELLVDNHIVLMNILMDNLAYKYGNKKEGSNE